MIAMETFARRLVAGRWLRYYRATCVDWLPQPWTWNMTDELLTRDQVAELLGIQPNSVRDTLRRYGITERRGYPRAAVEMLAAPGGRPGRGARTDRTREAASG